MNDFIIDNALESYNNNFNRLDSFDFFQSCTVQLALEAFCTVQVLSRVALSNKPRDERWLRTYPGKAFHFGQ